MLRTVFGWIFALLGLAIVLDLFGVGFGVHGFFPTQVANGILGVLLIVIGIGLTSGWWPGNRG